MTHYEVLGVGADASASDVRRAYLRLARQHHPDHQGDASPGDRAAAEREMQRVNEAWAVLGDDVRRRDYDRELAAARRATWAPGTVSPDFVPLDDGDDPEDPAAAYDVPYGDGSPVHRSLQVGPPFVGLLGLLGMGAGALLDHRPLLALGIAGLVASAVLFVATPVYAILRSHRRTRE